MKEDRKMMDVICTLNMLVQNGTITSQMAKKLRKKIADEIGANIIKLN